GAGLYFWFTEFQEGAQEEVGDSATASMKTMSLASAAIMLNPLDDNMEVIGADATDDTQVLNPNGDGSIFYALESSLSPSGSGPGPNGKDGEGWRDERFVVEIPIIIASKSDLNDVTLTALEPRSLTGILRGGMWLHLDRDNDYQLLKGDGKAFVGYISNSTTEVPVDVNGYTYYFGGDSHLGLNLTHTSSVNASTGTVKDDPTTYSEDESDIYYPLISKTAGSLCVMKLYTDDVTTKYAFAKNDSGAELGWITSNYSATATALDQYFTGDKLKPIFENKVYKVADELPANEAVIGYAYFMVNVLTLDDDGVAEIELPFRVTTKEGLTETTTVTLTVKD
ncbi:hypothetical protein KA005_33980, partial [bacterium]|nr:hypothetical protein [bacterium]